MRILVIGAGASGLVTAKVLRERGHEVSIVTDSHTVGGTFENKAYKDARMVSSKYLTCFSDFRRPDAEMHMSLADYVTYLEEYATHFDLVSIIRRSITVISIRQNQMQEYIVQMSDNSDSKVWEEKYDAVAVCSGLHNYPRVPKFPGQESFTGSIFHSADYKDPEVLRGKHVLIIGTGETGFDIGYAAATHGAKSVTMSTRNGFVSVPSAFGEDKPPLDCIIMNYGTHYWESEFAQRVGLHWWITTKFTRLGFLFMTGTTYGFNQWVGKRYNMTWDEGRKHIVNKSARTMPLLSRKAKRESHWLLRTIYSWWDSEIPEGALDIDLVEGSVSSMQDKTVTYSTMKGERSVQADLVVLCTGYQQRFPFLFGDGKAGGPSLATGSDGSSKDDPLPSEHFIVNPEEPRLAYIGFIRPNVGAIPPMAELQAMWWCEKLEDNLACRAKDYYKLHESRLNYGVDYGYYMFALAREIRAVPSLLYWLLRRPKIALTCGFGQAHVPIFRLQGPFATKEAQEVCANELFAPLMKRPFMMNFIFAFEALCFAVINGVCVALENPRSRALVTFGVGAALFRKDSFKNCVNSLLIR